MNGIKVTKRNKKQYKGIMIYIFLAIWIIATIYDMMMGKGR